MIPAAFLAAVLWLGGDAGADSPQTLPGVSPVPDRVLLSFNLSRFYQKYLNAGGLPIVSSGKVNDYALLEARYIVNEMIGHRPDILRAIVRNKVRLAIMAPTEFTTDIPEHSDLRPRAYWDKRGRGFGASETRPACSCGEENLLGYPGDPNPEENILVHEFAHVIHQQGMPGVDKTFDARLKAAFEAATATGLWKDTYAATNRMEYWAEGAAIWFDTARANDFCHNFVSSRSQLKAYDPRLAALLTEVFGDGAWRYLHPDRRVPSSPHLVGYNPAGAPSFSWTVLLAQQKRRADEPPPLLPLPATARPEWHSAGSDHKVALEFINHSKKPVDLVWIDGTGRRREPVTMQAGQTLVQETFAGNVYCAQAEDGSLLGYFVAGERDAMAVFE